jgi:hypothetical protein
MMRGMYIATQHGSFVARNRRTGLLCHVRARPRSGGHLELVDIPDADAAQLQAAPGRFPAEGPLAGCEYVGSARAEIFALRRDGYFGAADPMTGAVVFDRETALTWEEFYFVPREAAGDMLRAIQDEHAFAESVRVLLEAGVPVRLHFGCGPRCIPGFLNVDKFPNHPEAENYFNFDFTEKPWPIPDASVDYIFSEDFIEHVPQKNQIAFLAEAFRVLKPGCYNRVNTPCLRTSMLQSDFSKGFTGVYFGEFDLWNHVALLTAGSLQELAEMIGYRHVFFTTKNRGTSIYAVPDIRPVDDRDELVGNIFADLLK